MTVPDAGHGVCQMCGRAFALDDSPMLDDGIWRSVSDDPDGYMCIDCMESRLGRKIAEPDLMTADFGHGRTHVLWNLKVLESIRHGDIPMPFDGRVSPPIT